MTTLKTELHSDWQALPTPALDCKVNLLKDEISSKEANIKVFEREWKNAQQLFHELEIEIDLKERLEIILQVLIERHRDITNTRIAKKLLSLYGGCLAMPSQTSGYVNLSSVDLTSIQIAFRNLGYNCHLNPKYK